MFRIIRYPGIASIIEQGVLGKRSPLGVHVFAVDDGFELRLKTCDEEFAATEDIVNISFCIGHDTCSPIEANPYNLNGELKKRGWASFHIPIDFEATTMVISKDNDDSW